MTNQTSSEWPEATVEASDSNGRPSLHQLLLHRSITREKLLSLPHIFKPNDTNTNRPRIQLNESHEGNHSVRLDIYDEVRVVLIRTAGKIKSTARHKTG